MGGMQAWPEGQGRGMVRGESKGAGAAHEQQKLLQGDLERLLRQRGSIDSLRTTLARLL